MATKDLALADQTITDAFPVIFDPTQRDSLAQILQDNFGDDGLNPLALPTVKIPTGGMTSWEIPDEDPTRTLTGFVVLHSKVRTYYRLSMQEAQAAGLENGPPDCASRDGKIGDGTYGVGSLQHPSGVCADCPMNEWKSATGGSGKGKACSEKKPLWLLREGDIFPTPVTLAPTSLSNWQGYMTRLGMKQIPYYGCVTEISLEKVKKNGIDVATATFRRGAVLSREQALQVRAFGQEWEQHIAEALTPATEVRVPDDEVIPAEYADTDA